MPDTIRKKKEEETFMRTMCQKLCYFSSTFINIFKINNSMEYVYPHFTDNFPNATHSQDSNRETNSRALNQISLALKKPIL